jgi:ribosomal protein S18 acetylase RimI-like enzyme
MLAAPSRREREVGRPPGTAEAIPVSVAIRTMEARDYREVVALWRACTGVGLGASDTRDGVARFLEANPGLSFVAEDGGRVVGAVLCGHDGRRGYITHLAVAREARGRGLGRALAERCTSALGLEGIEKCHIFVFGDNTDALAFWEAIGWTDRTELRVLSKFIRGETEAP